MHYFIIIFVRLEPTTIDKETAVGCDFEYIFICIVLQNTFMIQPWDSVGYCLLGCKFLSSWETIACRLVVTHPSVDLVGCWGRGSPHSFDINSLTLLRSASDRYTAALDRLVAIAIVFATAWHLSSP